MGLSFPHEQVWRWEDNSTRYKLLLEAGPTGSSFTLYECKPSDPHFKNVGFVAFPAELEKDVLSALMNILSKRAEPTHVEEVRGHKHRL
jgi:hypothetical protein